MKALKKIPAVLLVTAVILTAIFLAGRYGWKLGGFRDCLQHPRAAPLRISGLSEKRSAAMVRGECGLDRLFLI